MNILRRVGYLLVVGIALLGMTACGGGGGGGSAPAPTATVTGTVTGNQQQTPTQVTVSALDAQGQTVKSTTTDAAGRYTLAGLPAGQTLTLQATGGSESFAASAAVNLPADVTSVVDLYLPNDIATSPATVDLATQSTDQTISSSDSVDNATTVRVTIQVADDFTSGGSAFTGTLEVAVTPIDVSRLENGLAPPPIAPLAVGANQVLELFAAGGLGLHDTAGNAVGIASNSTLTLELPVPSAYTTAAVDADTAGTLQVQHFDTATGSWVDVDTVSASLNGAQTHIVLEVDEPGLWRVGQAVTAADISGTLQFSDGSPAAGVTVYANGGDYGYLQVTVTDASGNFSLQAKDNAPVDLEFVAWGNGLQLSDTQSITSLDATTGDLGTVSLSYAKPTAGVPSAVTLTLDPNAIQSYALHLASGRVLPFDTGIVTYNSAESFSEMFFSTNTIDPLILEANEDSGANPLAYFEVITNTAFDNVTDISSLTFADVSVDLSTATAPVVVGVKTQDGHYGKLSIDTITDNQDGTWTITFRSMFSLDGTF